MGLFDRWSKACHTDVSNSASDGASAEQDATRVLEEGLALEKQGQMDEALRCYDSAIKLMPELARAHFNRGNILFDRGDDHAALQAYSQAVQHKPDSASAHYNMGNAHLRLGNPGAAVLAYRQAIALRPDFADAHAALAAAMEIAPDEADIYFEQGLAQQDLAQLERAKALYRQVLEIKPDHVNANNNLGGILLLEGKLDEALACFRRAVEAAPANAATQINLGDALRALGLMDEAMASYRRALEITPESATACIRLGDAQIELGELADAVASYRRALEIEPVNSETNMKQGAALQELGQLALAESCYRRVLEIEPDSAGAHSNLGVIMKKLKKFDAAEASFRQALVVQPNFAEAHANLGNVLQAQGQIDAAAASYRRALEIKPDLADAHSNYGTLWQYLEKFDLAEASYRRALEINPDLSLAHINLGIVLSQVRRFDDSIASYKRAIAIKPDYANVYANLGDVLKDVGRLDDSLACLRRALELDADCAVAHHNLLFINNYIADQPASLLLSDAQRFGDMTARLARPYTSWPNLPNAKRRLRVGLVSGDLCSHPVGYFLVSVLEALSSQASPQLELYAYPTRVCDDVTSKRLQACCRGWHLSAWLSDEALARRIREDGIDILLDLSGHTGHNRLSLFAWKPAPVQVSWLGYFATTGVAAMDYFIADPWTLPQDQETYFTERIWRLPETRLCFTPPDTNVTVGPLPALSNGYITFGCFNNLSKMNDAVVALWAQVLHKVPGSRLFLKYQQFAEASVRQRTCQRFAIHGIDSNRLSFEDYTARESYLAAYHRVDLALDPFPFPGGTTTVEALWMGVPVLTLAGERFLSRQGVGLLMNAGLPEWVASDPDDYVARAVSHASDLQRLATLRAGLRQQVLASPIYDASRFARNFETALRGMWIRWCEAQHSHGSMNP